MLELHDKLALRCNATWTSMHLPSGLPLRDVYAADHVSSLD